MVPLFARVFADDSGQDLVEYALLTTFIGFSSIAVFDVIRSAIQVVYTSWNTSTNSNWRPPDPS
jgi:Flp pilus assembly pilin Flp